MCECFITRDRSDEEEPMTYPNEAKPCPVCGHKAFVSKDIVDGFYFGWSVGCPRFKIDDGIHGYTADSPEEEKLTGFNYCTKEAAIMAWNDRVECGRWRISPWMTEEQS